MKAREVMTGDVLTDSNGNWMVRDFEPQGVDGSDSRVQIRLSAGRTDPGTWYEVNADREVEIYRSGD